MRYKMEQAMTNLACIVSIGQLPLFLCLHLYLYLYLCFFVFRLEKRNWYRLEFLRPVTYDTSHHVIVTYDTSHLWHIDESNTVRRPRSSWWSHVSLVMPLANSRQMPKALMIHQKHISTAWLVHWSLIASKTDPQSQQKRQCIEIFHHMISNLCVSYFCLPLWLFSQQIIFWNLYVMLHQGPCVSGIASAFISPIKVLECITGAAVSLSLGITGITQTSAFPPNCWMGG